MIVCKFLGVGECFVTGPTRAQIARFYTRAALIHSDIRSYKRKEWQYSRFSKQEFRMKKNKCDIMFGSGSFCLYKLKAEKMKFAAIIIWQIKQWKESCLNKDE